LLTLKSLLSISATENLQIIHPDTAALLSMRLLPGVDEVLERTVNSLPDLKISQYNIDIAKIGLKMSKASYLPTVSLSGSVGTGHTNYAGLGTQFSNRLNEQIGISVSIPIFDNSRTKSKVTQSRIALQQAELSQKQTELGLRQTILQEYRNVVSSHNSFETSSIREKAYSASLNAYRKQYEAGAITTVELLQQQNNYINALNEYIQDKYGFMLKRKILDVYMGKIMNYEL
jgi:outer membrane protein